MGRPEDVAMSKSGEPPASDNQVYLRGRLADDPVYRELPSGDVLAVFRMTVARPPGDRARVDSIECATVKVRAHKTLERANAGDDLEVVGSLHRRFWRTPAGPASRYAVDADTVRLIKAARAVKTGRRGGASPDRTPASA
jgi:single-strand DNA-binding protein